MLVHGELPYYRILKKHRDNVIKIRVRFYLIRTFKKVVAVVIFISL